MKTIDDEIRFHLAETGWYLGETKIGFFDESLAELGINPSIVSFHSGIEGFAETDGELIRLDESLKWGASQIQRMFLAAHEWFHMRLGHCEGDLDMSRRACHAREYLADKLAIRLLKKHGSNRHEIRDAINVFKEIIVERESNKHPSSEDRYWRLMEEVS